MAVCLYCAWTEVTVTGGAGLSWKTRGKLSNAGTGIVTLV